MSRALGPVILAAAAFAVPSAAGQMTATLQAARTCYRPGQRVVLTAAATSPAGAWCSAPPSRATGGGGPCDSARRFPPVAAAR